MCSSLCTSVKYCILLLWLSVSLIIPLFIFARGLLLHRDVLSRKSSCISDQFTACYEQSPNSTKLDGCLQFFNHSASEQYCSSSDFRVILIIIDALRYDFAKFNYTTGNADIPPFTNRLTVIRDLLETKSERSRLFKFIAHPPTTTLQRIHALTTGSLPTFIEIGSNFGSREIEDDNLIDLLKQYEKKAVFLGDDTWCKLYPNRFIRTYQFDSFNVWDLDLVDDGIQEHLIPEVRKRDWHLLIAHFLGVDHCGHKYGPFHPEMKRKLDEMNAMLKDVVNEIKRRENVILFVIGDHGMTTTGDHGGETDNEVTSAVFVHSPVLPLHDVFLRQSDAVTQVDLVPTLSSILGIPIPFSNIGRVILECLPSVLVPAISDVAFLLWQNVEQITTYVHEYGEQNTQMRTSQQLNPVRLHHAKLREMWFNISTENMSTFISECEAYMENVLQMCKVVWIQFHMKLVVLGIACMTLTLILSILIVHGSLVERLDVLTSFLPLLFVSLCSVSLLIAICWYFFSISELEIFALIEICSVLLTIRLCFKLHPSSKTVALNLSNKLTLLDLFSFFVFLCSLLALFSNSFILEEPSVMLFFCGSCTWMSVFSSHHFRRSSPVNVQSNTSKIFNVCRIRIVAYAAVISIGFRISLNFVRCREDQKCVYEDTERRHDVGLCIMAVVILISYIVFWRRRMRRVELPVWWCLPVLHVALLSVHWMGEAVVNIRNIPFINEIPAVLLVTCAVIICYLFYNPLPFRISTRKDRRKYSTLAFDAAWASISVFLCVIGCVLLGQRYALSTVSMFVCSYWFTTLFLDVRKDVSVSAYDVPWSQVFLWGFSSTYWFYVTGHYASFSAIEWNAAFLIQKEIGSSMLIPGILVMMNTFMSYAVHGLLLTSLLPAQPHSTSHIHSTESSRNEEVVSRDADAFYDGVFVLVLKYISSYAVRMLVIMLSCALHARHLMMWAIFAPKLIFEAVAFVAITIPSSLMGAALAMRVKYRISRFSSWNR